MAEDDNNEITMDDQVISVEDVASDEPDPTQSINMIKFIMDR